MKFNDTLNDKIWDLNTEELIPEVKEKLEEIAEAFIEFLEIPTDAVLDKVITGSSASYNYNEFSDLDLHIIVDYDKVHEDCPLVNGYLNSLKKQFNDNHDIFIHGVPVELYAEQKDQGTVHNGLYSLQTGWIDKPQKIAPTDNDAAVEAKYSEIKELVDKCDDSEEATELLEKIYNMRKAGLAEAGEFCTENLAFKKLRNEGCMDKLRQIKKEQIDKQLSLESYNEEVKELNNSENEKLIKQIFPEATHTFVMLDNDRGHISFELPIEGGREDNEFIIWIFNNNIDIRYTNHSLGGIAYVGQIETDINFSEFESKLREILEMVKPNIENYYKKLVQEQTTITSEDDEDSWEEELSNFICKLPNTLKLSKLYDVDITDGTVYVNCNKYPNNTVFIEPIEDSTQLIKIGLLDDSNMEITSEELELEDFGKEDIQNIRVTVKELFNSKNESIKETYINFEGYDFKGIVNPETGDITYSTVTPKYRRVINADKKLNIKDSKLDTKEWEIVQKAKRALNKNESIKEPKNYNENVDRIVVDNYLKMLLDNGHIVDTPDSQYIVQVFTNKKLQKLVEFDDIRKAAETFIEFTDIYTKNEDVVLFKQMRDNGKDIKTIDSTWLNVSNKNESIKESLQDEYKEAFDLLVEGANIVGTLNTDFGKQFVKDVENLYKLKSDKLKLSVAKEMLKDIQGYLVDEQYDDYNAKIDKFMNNSKNESIKENSEILKSLTKDEEGELRRYIIKEYLNPILSRYIDNISYFVFDFNAFTNRLLINLFFSDPLRSNNNGDKLIEELKSLGLRQVKLRIKSDLIISAIVKKELLRKFTDFILNERSKNESLNKLEETLKKAKDMEINEGMWASPFTMENAKQVAELLSKPITYEELNSEEGKQKVWNIIGDDEFWDNVGDEAFDNPEEDARYLIVKFLEDWMERKESFNDDAYSKDAENIIKKAIFMFNGITEDINSLQNTVSSLENIMGEALDENSIVAKFKDMVKRAVHDCKDQYMLKVIDPAIEQFTEQNPGYLVRLGIDNGSIYLNLIDKEADLEDDWDDGSFYQAEINTKNRKIHFNDLESNYMFESLNEDVQNLFRFDGPQNFLLIHVDEGKIDYCVVHSKKGNKPVCKVIHPYYTEGPKTLDDMHIEKLWKVEETYKEYIERVASNYKIDVDFTEIESLMNKELIPESFNSLVKDISKVHNIKLTEELNAIVNEALDDVIMRISEWIDKLGFEDVSSGNILKFRYSGNHKHVILCKDDKLQYTNDQGDELTFDMNNIDVQRAFKQISKIFDGLE